MIGRPALALAGALASVAVACGPAPGDECADCADATPPACSPGASEACYSGLATTQDVGECHGGIRTCGDDGTWGRCEGEVTPRGEDCTNGLDENCNGLADEDRDLDGDGFSTCDNDCCDDPAQGCASPELVNVGAFEAPGNGVDDDCDGTIDNAVAAACDGDIPSNASDPLDYARAIDLCQTTTQNDRRWGVISGRFRLADSTGVPDATQRSIRPTFGSTAVQGGSALVVLSTGHAAAVGQLNPGFAAFQPGQATNNTSDFPADWIDAHGGALPNAPGCPPPTGDVANDPILLELRVRTPTNARSFRLRTNFLSAEYPEWTCSPYNDFFVVLLDSTWAGAPANPADKNLAIYTSPSGAAYPVGVNLAYGDTGLFTVCKNGEIGCQQEATRGTISTCLGTAALVGTGFDPTATVQARCGDNDQVGGGTGWLTTRGNVVGGEIVTLRFALWDTSDHILDSVALIDAFEWSVESSEPGTVVVE